MQQKFWINVREKPAFLVAMMRELAGSDSQIMFEGNLSKCNFSNIEQLPITGEIHVCDSASENIVLPLTKNNIKPILKQVLPEGRVVHKINHIQIQKRNEIQLMVGDNFHNECISVGSMVSLEFLSILKKNGIIRKIQTDTEAKAKYLWFNT